MSFANLIQKSKSLLFPLYNFHTYFWNMSIFNFMGSQNVSRWQQAWIAKGTFNTKQQQRSALSVLTRLTSQYSPYLLYSNNLILDYEKKTKVIYVKGHKRPCLILNLKIISRPVEIKQISNIHFKKSWNAFKLCVLCHILYYNSRN